MRYIVYSGRKILAEEGPLVLASNSATRRALLTDAGFVVEVVSPDIDERYVQERYLGAGGSIDDLAVCLAKA